MAINFPASPTDGQTFDSGEIVYKYDGTKNYWYVFQYSSARGPLGYTGSKGDTGAQGPIGYTGSKGVELAYGSFYDNAGGVDVSSGDIVVFDSTHTNSSGFSLNTTTGVITSNVTGDILINYNVSLGVSSGTSNRSESYIYLQKYNGSTWDNISGSQSWTYHRMSSQGKNTGSGSVILSVTNGDTFRIYAIRNSGGDTISTVADASNITFLKL